MILFIILIVLGCIACCRWCYSNFDCCRKCSRRHCSCCITNNNNTNYGSDDHCPREVRVAMQDDSVWDDTYQMNKEYVSEDESELALREGDTNMNPKNTSGRVRKPIISRNRPKNVENVSDRVRKPIERRDR